MKKKSDFLESNKNNLINSFKNINFNIVIMVFYDLLFLSISGLVVYSGFKFLEKRALAVNLPANILALSAQQAENLLGGLRGFFFLLIFTVVLLILIIILLWSLFKGLNWNLATSKKFNLDFFKKFALLNLIWLGSIVLLIFLVSLGFNQNTVPIFLLIIFIISVYLTNILYALFTKENSFKTIKKAFKLGITKIHYFVFPYTVIALFLYIISKLLSLVAMPQRTYLIISVLAFTIIIAWFRLYIVEVVSSIEPK